MDQNLLNRKAEIKEKLLALGVSTVNARYEYGRIISNQDGADAVILENVNEDEIGSSDDLQNELKGFLEKLVDSMKPQGDLNWHLSTDDFTNQAYTMTLDEPTGWDEVFLLPRMCMISGYKLVPERVTGRCTGCAFSNRSFGDKFCPEVPCSNTAQGGLGVQAIAVPLDEPDYEQKLKGKTMCRASEDLLSRIRGGAEFPDATFSVAQKFGVNQQELEAEYDRLTTN